MTVLLETHWGFLSVQEHRDETLISDVEVVKSNAMKNRRTLIKSGDLRALLETHRSVLSVQEHREETLICNVEVAKYNAIRKSKNPGQIL